MCFCRFVGSKTEEEVWAYVCIAGFILGIPVCFFFSISFLGTLILKKQLKFNFLLMFQVQYSYAPPYQAEPSRLAVVGEGEE